MDRNWQEFMEQKYVIEVGNVCPCFINERVKDIKWCKITKIQDDKIRGYWYLDEECKHKNGLHVEFMKRVSFEETIEHLLNN